MVTLLVAAALAQSPFTAAELAKVHDARAKARREQLAELRGPRSPLAYHREHLEGTDAVVVLGSAPDAGVRLEGAPVKVAEVRHSAAGFFLEPLEGGLFDVKTRAPVEASSQPWAEGRELGFGTRYVMSVRTRSDGVPYVESYDAAAPELVAYKGPPYYLDDDAFAAPATLDKRGDKKGSMQRSHGGTLVLPEAGVLAFSLGGRALSLVAYDEGGGELFVPFADSTNGKGTYGGGRYLTPTKLDGGRWLVDFNTAWNPLCVYNADYSCALPPRENRLPVAVEAGERMP